MDPISETASNNSDESDERNEAPRVTINQKNRYQQRRKDSTASATPSASSTTPIIADYRKQRSISQNSYDSSTSSEVKLANLQLKIKICLGILVAVCVVVIALAFAVIYLFTKVHTSNDSFQSGGTSGQFSSPGGSSGFAVNDNELCMMCKKLQLLEPSSNVILDKLTKKMFSGRQYCCAKTAEQIDIFLERYIDVKFKKERANGGLCMGTSAGLRTARSASYQGKAKCVDAPKPAAHLIGSDGLGDGSTKVITKWVDTSNSDISFRDGVSYDDKTGALIIPKNGLYYVYSQVHLIQTFPRVSTTTLYSQQKPNRTPNTESLSHYIKRARILHGLTEVVLGRRQSQCWVTNRLFSDYTSHLGGQINFKKGDEIYVEVSNKSMCSNHPTMNFFGLFYIGPTNSSGMR